MPDEPERLLVGNFTWNMMKDPPMPYPGVPGAAIPRRFTAEVRDPDNAVVVGLEVEVEDGRARMRSIRIDAEGEPLTPSALRRLPIGSYLDVVISISLHSVEQMSDGSFHIAPLRDFDKALDVIKAGKSSRRRRQPLTRERLELAVSAYREAPLRRKSEWVAEQLGVEPSYARQLIHRARKEGLLDDR